MAKQTFTTGQVLTAAQMTSLQQTAMLGGAASAKVASYVLVAADAGDGITMNNAGATTITVNTGLFAAGDVVTIINIGAGACTITAGTATVTTSGSLVLAQNQGGVLRFTSPSAAIFLQFATPASGDIEGVTATSPLTGGGTSGTVTIGIQSASTAQLGAVQLTDSTASTSITTAATPNSVKTSYDLAAAAIPKSTVTTAGDLIYATASSTVTRRGIGSEGQVLTVSSGVPAWTTLSSGAYTSLASGSLGSGALSLTSISGSYRDIVLILEAWTVGSAITPTFTVNNSSSNTAYGLVSTWANATAGTGVAQIASNSTSLRICPLTAWTGSNGNNAIITFKNYASTTSKKYGTVEGTFYNNTGQAAITHFGNAFFDQSSAITRLDFAGSQFTGGTYVLYGVK